MSQINRLVTLKGHNYTYELYLDELLGRGAISEVFKGKILGDYQQTQQTVAIKVLRDKKIENSQKNNYLEREYEFSKTISKKQKEDEIDGNINENVLRILDCLDSNANINQIQCLSSQNSRMFDQNNHRLEKYIVTEYCNSSNLFNLMVDNAYSIDQKQAIDISLQIAKGLQFLHSLNIMHRDLKPENIFLHKVNDRLVCKIGDFGIVKRFENISIEQSQVGTINYMSPEIINKHQYSKEADFWSLGCIISEIKYGKQKFSGFTQDEVVQKIKNYRNSLYSSYSTNQPLDNIIQKCLMIGGYKQIEEIIRDLENLKNGPQLSNIITEQGLRFKFTKSFHSSNSSQNVPSFNFNQIDEQSSQSQLNTHNLFYQVKITNPQQQQQSQQHYFHFKEYNVKNEQNRENDKNQKEQEPKNNDLYLQIESNQLKQRKNQNPQNNSSWNNEKQKSVGIKQNDQKSDRNSNMIMYKNNISKEINNIQENQKFHKGKQEVLKYPHQQIQLSQNNLKQQVNQTQNNCNFHHQPIRQNQQSIQPNQTYQNIKNPSQEEIKFHSPQKPQNIQNEAFQPYFPEPNQNLMLQKNQNQIAPNVLNSSSRTQKSNLNQSEFDNNNHNSKQLQQQVQNIQQNSQNNKTQNLQNQNENKKNVIDSSQDSTASYKRSNRHQNSETENINDSIQTQQINQQQSSFKNFENYFPGEQIDSKLRVVSIPAQSDQFKKIKARSVSKNIYYEQKFQQQKPKK